MEKELEKQKNNAYWERNQLVSALSKLMPAWLGKHDENDKGWEKDWRTIVFMEIPAKFRFPGDEVLYQDFPHQISWHIHDSDIPMFDHLAYEYCDKISGTSYKWDGHNTEEKYRRLRTIKKNG